MAKMDTRIITVANIKGGCAKSTSCANISAGIAERGKKVLIIDLDPQASLSITFGIDVTTLPATIANVLKDRSFPISNAIVSKKNVDILPSNIKLAIVQRELQLVTAGEFILKRKIEELLKNTFYDFVFIDTPPMLGLLLDSALLASTEVIVPIDCGYYSLYGISDLLNAIEEIKSINKDLQLGGVFVTMVENTILSKQVLSEVKNQFGSTMFNTSIRKRVKIAEAPSNHMTIYEYDRVASEDYNNLSNEVLLCQRREV